MGGPGSGRRRGDGRSWKAGFSSNPNRPVARAVNVDSLSAPQVDLLIEHIDCAVGVHRRRIRLTRSLIRLGLIRPEANAQVRPRFTVLTDIGRGTVANLLARQADALAEGQPRETPLQILRRLKTAARTGAKCTTNAESLVHFSTPGAWTGGR